MNHQHLFVKSPARLPLLTEQGRAFLGLENSKSPQFAQKVKSLFEYLNGLLGFANTPEGKKQQEIFNILLRAVYPEVMLDLADIIYVQHERPAVVLNFDHIHINLRKDRGSPQQSLEKLNHELGQLFELLAHTLRDDPLLYNDPEIVRLLSESYSLYLKQTGNFPWDDPLPEIPQDPDHPVLDVATGLAGFSLMNCWPENHPRLVLSDEMPFILQGLTRFKQMIGKKNVEILSLKFPAKESGLMFGCILANKFLHHLQRPERRQFLHWALDSLDPGGTLKILDTDLEYQILKQARQAGFRGSLIPGYAETLVEIEGNFCENLVQDTRQAGFDVIHYDFHEYRDETDAYSRKPGDNLTLKFVGFEIAAQKKMS